jgi:hypothetical protein
MSIFSDAGNATLGEIISYLSGLPLDMVVKQGFTNAHSYRGYYEDLAFEPAPNVTVRQMLQCAKDALGRKFQGYKGGEYAMGEHTDCWLAEYGSSGVPIVLPGRAAVYVLPTV